MTTDQRDDDGAEIGVDERVEVDRRILLVGWSESSRRSSSRAHPHAAARRPLRRDPMPHPAATRGMLSSPLDGPARRARSPSTRPPTLEDPLAPWPSAREAAPARDSDAPSSVPPAGPRPLRRPPLRPRDRRADTRGGGASRRARGSHRGRGARGRGCPASHRRSPRRGAPEPGCASRARRRAWPSGRRGVRLRRPGRPADHARRRIAGHHPPGALGRHAPDRHRGHLNPRARGSVALPSGHAFRPSSRRRQARGALPSPARAAAAGRPHAATDARGVRRAGASRRRARSAPSQHGSWPPVVDCCCGARRGPARRASRGSSPTRSAPTSSRSRRSCPASPRSGRRSPRRRIGSPCTEPARSCSSTRSTDSTRPSRTRCCPTSRTARSRSSVRRPRTRTSR